MFYEWRPYVPVAQRRRQAAREMDKLSKKGHPVSPVTIDGRTIAGTFWGKSWCDNLERYSDYANRMPRGRTYVRNARWWICRSRPAWSPPWSAARSCTKSRSR